jgi:hypothetical protein
VRVLYGAPAAALAELLARHGQPAVLEAIDRAPIELGVQLLAGHLAEQLEAGPGVLEQLEAAGAGEQLATVTTIPGSGAVAPYVAPAPISEEERAAGLEVARRLRADRAGDAMGTPPGAPGWQTEGEEALAP